MVTSVELTAQGCLLAGRLDQLAEIAEQGAGWNGLRRPFRQFHRLRFLLSHLQTPIPAALHPHRSA
jgi:hypothetical protein